MRYVLQVLSWSNMGASQSAHGHVNPKRKSQVRLLFAPWGYVEDRNASAHLRQCATFLYLKRGIQVMRRTASHTQMANGANSGSSRHDVGSKYRGGHGGHGKD